jgi:SAM-dependent methyltransferase
MQSEILPDFRELSGDAKFQPLTAAELQDEPDGEFLDFIRRCATQQSTSESGIRILDFGCGRGGTVGRLRRLGWRTFGVEIEQKFIAAGAIVNAGNGGVYPVLSVMDDGGRTIFPDGFFDSVISDQVLEHVADLGNVASEIARILRPGGYVFHRLPAQYLFVEPHYRLPLVHWLPKNGVRRAAISALVSMGHPVPLPPDMPARHRTDVIHRYSCDHTYYRSPAAIASEFRKHGIRLDFVSAQRRWIRRKLHGRVPPSAADVAASLPGLPWMLGRFHQCRIVGRKMDLQDVEEADR